MALEKGSVVEGIITGVAKFGAFVGLPEGLKGLVHISEISRDYVTDINQYIKVGDKVKVKVLGETKPGKYDLSIKQLEEPPASALRPQVNQHYVQSRKPMEDSFESKITRFLKQSDEKLLDLKKHLQNKQEKKKKKKFIAK